MMKENDGNTPKVSVLMPVYKTKEAHLRQAIESILRQTFTDFEFLILDDCPEFPSEYIVNSYKDERIIYIKNEHNLGITDSRNKLIDMARGEYLAVMDHDDISLPERLAKEAKFLDRHPKVGVVGSWYERFPDGKIKKRFVINSQIERDLMYNCSILHPSSMIRKSVLSENNIRYEKKYSPSEDYALWCNLIGKTEFANIPEVLIKYRDHEENTSKKQSQKMDEAAKEIRRTMENRFPQLAKEASIKEKIYFCGVPVGTRTYRGCNHKTKWLNLFKTGGMEEIIMEDKSDLPVYIICYNRLSYLQQIIRCLEEYNITNIHIIDNCSSYPPLLEYLRKTPHKVHKMKENYGHMVFFKADEFKNVRENEYYVLTDPDVIPVDECPADFMSYFYQILQKFPKVTKVGFSLKTDDIPDDIPSAKITRLWEIQFYRKKLKNTVPYWYDSYIDTTFALYRPLKTMNKNDFFKAIRVGAPYEARHLPWYKKPSEMTDEDKFYNQTDCGSGNWNNADNFKKIEEELISKTPQRRIEKVFSVKSSYRRTVIWFLGIKLTLNKKK